MLSDVVTDAAAADPARPAVRDPDRTLTYAELAQETGRLAAFLHAKGLLPGDRVAILMPVSVTTSVAVHGIFRAGGAFVPLDPEAPAERLRALLQDCGVRHIVADPSVRARLFAALGEAPCVIVGTGGDDPREVDWNEVRALPPEAPDLPRDPQRLAYVMYTSGSTGTPKGIAHSHTSGLAYAARAVTTYALGRADVVAVTGPLHFDISTLAHLAAPLAGATAALVTTACARLPASLAAWLAQTRATVLYTVSSSVVGLVDRGALERQDLSALRWILFCGEPLPPAHLARAMARFPQAWFSNSYGPAEVNQCTFYHIAPGSDATAFEDQIPIGWCWSETKGLLVDQGEISESEGEIVIASPTMMLGYWNRPELDAKAYYYSAAGEKYYKTGDLARIGMEGYVLLGRIDRQVKVRGYRVELDEIEVTLAAHPDVSEAAVYPVLRGEAVVDLAATVIARGADDGLALRRFLAGRLPAYAVPGRIDVAPALPRTTSGKIDRRALAEAARLPADARS